MVEAGAARVIASDPDEGSHERARERGIEIASFDELMAEAAIVVATTGRPGLIEPDLVREGQVILALTNPDPEITPSRCARRRRRLRRRRLDGQQRARLPRHLPRRAEAGAGAISTGMKLAAARAIAGLAEESELVPDALDPDVHAEVAAAVREAAVAEGLARPERVPAGL